FSGPQSRASAWDQNPAAPSILSLPAHQNVNSKDRMCRLRSRATPQERGERKQSPNLYSRLDAATAGDIAYGAEPLHAKRPVKGQERDTNPHQAATALAANKSWPLQSGPRLVVPLPVQPIGRPPARRRQSA